MQIDLKWVNRNVGEDGTKLYRATSTIDTANLPTPVTTLAPGVNTYTDTDIIRGQKYHYRMGVFKGHDFVLSDEIVAHALPRTGPGPQELVAGDYEAGYFGTVSAINFFTGDEIAFRVSLASGTSVNISTDWLKFAHKGKILFIPKMPIRHTISWQHLYNAGVVYSSGDGPAHKPPVAAIPQGKIISKNGEDFKVRLMTGAPTNPLSFTTTGTADTIGLDGSEWNDLLYRVCVQIPFSQKGENWANFPVAELIQAHGTICQEVDTSKSIILIRGTAGYMGYAIASTHYSTPTTVIGWRPVLEYIPN